MAGMSSQQMRETFKLPRLPGNNFQEEMFKKNYGKKSIASEMGSGGAAARVPVDFEALAIKDEPAEPGTTQPRTLALDRKVLRFSAYFKEPVHESREESERVRRCTVFYFLEDDTISVAEPREDNSGMPQGCMLKRHQVMRPDGQGMYSFEDLNVGVDLEIYGKCFHLCDCDAFTHKFLTGLGIEVPDSGETFPDDAHQKVRGAKEQKARDPEDRHLKSVMESVFSGKRSRLAPHELAASQKFLRNDRKVLKFKARWDDRTALYGDDRLFTLYYFLSDDTIEVTEDLAMNAGRDPFPSFTRRQRCAKPNPDTGRFENARAGLSFKARKGEDGLDDMYTEQDLYIGCRVNIFGRVFLLYDADTFTKGYLKNVLGREDTPLEVKEAKPEKKKPEPPPYAGFGDEEDSLGSWRNLVLKAPRKNVRQYIENAGSMLKFSMKLADADPANEVRRFVLTYYLADDTCSIFEPPQRNAGIIGGKFLQRQKAKNSDTGAVLKADDFFVGQKININRHRFVIFATDEKSLAHMEQNSGQFLQSNINTIINKLRCMMVSTQTNLEQEFIRADADKSGTIDYKEFAVIFENLGLPVSEQEVLTVLRFLDTNLDGVLTYKEVLGCICSDGNTVPNSDPRDWRLILDEVDREIKWEKTMAQRELKGHDDRFSATAAHAAKFFVDRYKERRVLFHNAFRSCADHATDGRIGAPEFRKAVDAKLKLGFDDRQVDALCAKLFPRGLERVSYDEFLKIMQGTSLHASTAASIAAFKPTD